MPSHPKLEDITIGQTEIYEYLSAENDFTFELEVLKKVRAVNRVTCDHGGSYTDPVTSKKRQFDLRARIRRNGISEIHLAVECKNLSENFPLIVQTTPRTADESYHVLWHSEQHQIVAQVLRHTQSQYHIKSPVGKACLQLGKSKSDATWTANDASVYDRWAQAVSSAQALLVPLRDKLICNPSRAFCFVVPVLVVSNGMLWQAEYNQAGEYTGKTNQVDHVQFFLGAQTSIPESPALRNLFPSSENTQPFLDMTFSHLEIMTLEGLNNFLYKHSQCPEDDSFFDYQLGN